VDWSPWLDCLPAAVATPLEFDDDTTLLLGLDSTVQVRGCPGVAFGWAYCCTLQRSGVFSAAAAAARGASNHKHLACPSRLPLMAVCCRCCKM
jgi:hypothetical protein